jgi:hypothetical protein
VGRNWRAMGGTIRGAWRQTEAAEKRAAARAPCDVEKCPRVAVGTLGTVFHGTLAVCAEHGGGHMRPVEADAVPAAEASGAEFSEDRRYRYRLWRRWAPGDHALFVMLNPSTEAETEADATIRRCIGFARAWGYGAVRVVNTHALVSTDPHALRLQSSPAGERNLDVVRDELRDPGLGVVVCAWGAFPEGQTRGTVIAELVREAGREPMCLGMTKEGCPRHPLYLAASTRPTPFTRRNIVAPTKEAQ